MLKDLSFTMEKGEVLGLVGNPAVEKHLAKVILGLLKPDSGTVTVSGNRPQMVFQDPYGSLNPAKKIGWIMEEPLRIQRKLPGKERRQKVLEMLKKSVWMKNCRPLPEPAFRWAETESLHRGSVDDKSRAFGGR